jgi:tetratricopeptide (TPR) repeat protein
VDSFALGSEFNLKNLVKFVIFFTMRKQILLSLLLLTFGLTQAVELPDGLKYKQIRKQLSPDSRPVFKQADNYLKSGQYFRANELYGNLIKKKANFYAYWASAWSAWQMKNIADARALYLKAYQMNDSLGLFLRNYADFVLSIEPDWKIIGRIAAAYYRIQPNDEALIFIIDNIRNEADRRAALALLENLDTEFPEAANIKVYYASLLNENGNTEKAVGLAQSAMELATDPYHLMILERLLANNGFFLDAAKVCEKLNKSAKRSEFAYEAWGHLEFKQGHYENAVVHYEKALRYTYNTASLLHLARLSHLYLNDCRKARYYCKAALQIDRSLVDAYFIMAETYRVTGDLDQALRFSAKQLELVSDHPYPYYYHGKLLYEKKEYQEALPFFEKAVELSPNVQRYRLVLAKCYAGAGMREKAAQTYQNFLDESLMDLWQEESTLREEPPAPR